MNRCKEKHPQTGQQCVLEEHPDKPNEHMINGWRNVPVSMETLESEIAGSLQWAGKRVHLCQSQHSGRGAEFCMAGDYNICAIARTLVRLHGVLEEKQKPKLVVVDG